MHIEYHNWYSHHLHREMALKVYGHAGKPVLVFPTSGGRFYEYEDFGMVDACRDSIRRGSIRLFAVDSVDNDTWMNPFASPANKGLLHNHFDRYIINELVPAISQYTGWNQPFMATGCSLGAYHAANFFFRHPDVFDTVVALSGLYSLRFSTGDCSDENVYFNSPLDYLPHLYDPWFIDRYRQGRLIFCAGQGAWENEILADTYALENILRKKHIPAWFDIWGYDVDHDWPWWRAQMPYFLEKLGY